MDRIEKSVVIKAPRARVWQAISDSKEFGLWFGVRFDGPFAAGCELRGAISPTTVDEEVAAMQKPYEGAPFTIWVQDVTPEGLFSFRWHPFAIDPSVDYSTEPTTLVEFRLDEVAGGTKLTISESGFDQIPVERRSSAFSANEGGWEHQAKLVAKYVERTVSP